MNKKIAKLFILLFITPVLALGATSLGTGEVNATSSHASVHSSSHTSSHSSAKSSSSRSSISSRTNAIRSASKSSVSSRTNSIRAGVKAAGSAGAVSASVNSRNNAQSTTAANSVNARAAKVTESIRNSSAYAKSSFNNRYGETSATTRSFYSGFGGFGQSPYMYLANPYVKNHLFYNYYVAGNILNHKSSNKDAQVLQDVVKKNTTKTYWIVLQSNGQETSVLVTKAQYQAIKVEDNVAIKQGKVFVNGVEVDE